MLRCWFSSKISTASTQSQSKFEQAYFFKNWNWQTDSKIYNGNTKKKKTLKNQNPLGKGRMKLRI